MKGSLSWTADDANLENATKFSQWVKGLFVDNKNTDDEHALSTRRWLHE